MIIADISKEGKSNGNIIIIEKPEEGQILIKAMEELVKSNKRKGTYKKVLKTLVENLGCY